jgi:magnesium chelatase subunit D
MERAIYPFAAIVGQDEMKLALMLAAVDWRLSVLLRGEKGSGKTTTARGLAALLPTPAPFINLPIGATEDRLIGGLHLERTLKGDPVLKPGLLSEAHGGVLYIDEINLLPAHLGDALLDTASSGVNVIEREGLSASHAAEFVLLGSMNPEEGSLRPQLLDRFALAVDIHSPTNPGERQTVVERRIAFERDPSTFTNHWSQEQNALRNKMSEARERLKFVLCSSEVLNYISATICEIGVRSLRADLAVMRASMAYAALIGEDSVELSHVDTVLPLVLAHRDRVGKHPPTAPPAPPQPPRTDSTTRENTKQAMERIFAPKEIGTPSIKTVSNESNKRGSNHSTQVNRPGPVVRSRLCENPNEIDLRATVTHAVAQTGFHQPRISDLHERIRKPHVGTRYLFVIDSSGSHAVKERMRLVKGAAEGLLARSFKEGDEVAMIVFRGTSAQIVLEPTRTMQDLSTALEYLPTGGRTPLAHALDLAKTYVTSSTVIVILTDGRANIALQTADPWQEALEIAGQLHCPAFVINTESGEQPLGQSRKLAEALRAQYLELEDLQTIVIADLSIDRSNQSRPPSST